MGAFTLDRSSLIHHELPVIDDDDRQQNQQKSRNYTALAKWVPTGKPRFSWVNCGNAKDICTKKKPSLLSMHNIDPDKFSEEKTGFLKRILRV